MFQDIDLGPYDLAREMGAYPYAIVQAEFKFPGKGKQLKNREGTCFSH